MELKTVSESIFAFRGKNGVRNGKKSQTPPTDGRKYTNDTRQRKEYTMQFIINAYDAKDEGALARRMNARPDHLANIKKVKEKGSVVCAGGITNEKGQPIGSFLVMEYATRALLDEYLENEPYIRAGVWQDVKVEPCSVVIMNDEMVGK